MKTKNCQFCLGEIDSRALKCMHCHEWQETMQPEQNGNDEKIDPEELYIVGATKKPFQLQIIERFKIHYIVVVFIVGVILFSLIQVSWYLLGEDVVYLYSFLAFVIQFIFMWAGLIWVYNLFKKNYQSFIQVSSKSRKEAIKEFASYQNKIFDSRNAIITGIIVGIIASGGDYLIGAPFQTTQAKLIFAIFEFVNMFFAGAAIYSIVNFSLYIHEISKDMLSEAINIDRNKGINNIGRIHLYTVGLVIVPFFFGVLAKIIGNWDWNIAVSVWYSIFAIVIVVYIYLPLTYIHRLMKKEADNKVAIVQNKIEALLNEINHNASSGNFIKLNEYRELEKSLSAQSTWPFDTKSVRAALSAVGLPLLFIVIEEYWSTWFG